MEENIGMVMGFTIISAALEWLGNKWEEIQQEEKELAEKIKQEEEEAEKVIKVPGGFKIWSRVATIWVVYVQWTIHISILHYFRGDWKVQK